MDNPFQQINERLFKIESLLVNIRIEKINNPTSEEEKLLTLKQAAHLISYSVPSMYRLINARQIPSIKKGGKILFSKEELLKWANEGRRRTVTEITEDAEKHLGKLGNKKTAHHS